jgi:cobalt-zinc-cadmium efflux system outer membrane protein
MGSTRTWWFTLAWCALAATPALAEEKITLEQALAEALEKNLSLLAERVNISIAEARLITARLRPNPVLSAGGDHLDLLGTGFNEINNAGPEEFNLRTDFTIERGGKRSSRIAVAQHALGVAELEFLNAVRGLRLEVQSAFVEALLARHRVELARQNLEALNRIVEVNQVRWRAGDVAEVELIRSRVAALQQANALRRAELDLRTVLIRLQTLMGRARPAPDFDVLGELRRETRVAPLEEWLKIALENRPDLLALRRAVQRSAAELQLELARAKPDLTLGSEYRRQQGLAGTGNMLGFFVQIPLPVFDRNQGEIARAREELRQAELRVRALEASIRAEVESAYRQWQSSRESLEQIETAMLAQAREVRDITEYAYRRSEASLLEFLDAQRAFNETMQAYYEARAEYAKSLYLLESSAGAGGKP